ncbi:MAG: single-stranded DNA-binding protein [Sphaerochaetaceae bacterium]|nr:single-stranded DNA-binding protein [Sphaerochaetaceae bacterium]
MENVFAERIVARTLRFRDEVERLRFTFDGVVYDPLVYAWEPHRQYLERYVHADVPIFFLGMNPGPFGMAQTGVPFGEVNAVRSWMGIEAPVSSPSIEHPGRPVTGFSTTRSEVSGKRLWGLMSDRSETAERFFASHCVMNYCPLVFLDSGSRAKNVTPDKLPKEEQRAMEVLCDGYLKDVLLLVAPKYLIGVGKYAQRKLEKAAGELQSSGYGPYTVGSIIHPSPGNPQANNGWAEKTIERMENLGAW